jgi:23S rRNA pseudouridine2457 synthase
LKRKKETVGRIVCISLRNYGNRLDEDSEGLLLLTTDGMMSEIIRSKKSRKNIMFKSMVLLIRKPSIK